MLWKIQPPKGPTRKMSISVKQRASVVGAWCSPLNDEPQLRLGNAKHRIDGF